MSCTLFPVVPGMVCQMLLSPPPSDVLLLPLSLLELEEGTEWVWKRVPSSSLPVLPPLPFSKLESEDDKKWRWVSPCQPLWPEAIFSVGFMTGLAQTMRLQQAMQFPTEQFTTKPKVACLMSCLLSCQIGAERSKLNIQAASVQTNTL